MTRKKSVPTLSSALFILLVGGAILWIGAFAGMYGFFIIGEENYVQLDALIPAGAWDKTLWQASNPERVFIEENTIWIRHKGEPTLTTPDLYLKDLKADFIVESTHKNAKGCLKSSNGGEALVCLSSENIYAKQTKKASIEVRWDDYKDGHYQIFVNEELTEEGSVESLRLTATTKHFTFDNDWADSGFQNHRWRPIWGCDQKDGEAVETVCVAGPESLTADDLDGLKRFCPDLAAKQHKDGLSKNSKQVYYSLAAGETVEIEENEMWEFSYIKDASVEGVGYSCDEYYNIENLEDLPVQEPEISDGRLEWTSFHNLGDDGWTRLDNVVKSGDEILFHVVAKTSDYPRTETITRYPGDHDAALIPVEANNVELLDGETHEYGNYFSAELSELQWRGVEADGLLEYTMTGRWILHLDADGLSITPAVAAAAKQGDTLALSAMIKNQFPFPVQLLVTTTFDQTIVGEERFQQETIVLDAGEEGEVVFDAPTDLSGRVDYAVVALLETDAGNIPLGTRETGSYAVAAAGEYLVEAEEKHGDDHGFLGEVWEWIASIFERVNKYFTR